MHGVRRRVRRAMPIARRFSFKLLLVLRIMVSKVEDEGEDDNEDEEEGD